MVLYSRTISKLDRLSLVLLIYVIASSDGWFLNVDVIFHAYLVIVLNLGLSVHTKTCSFFVRTLLTMRTFPSRYSGKLGVTKSIVIWSHFQFGTSKCCNST